MDLTVVMARGPLAERVRGLMADWCAAGLLGEFLWVSGENGGEEGAGDVRATRVTPWGTSDGDLFDLVAVRRIGLLRLVVVRCATAAGPEDGILDDARAVAERLHAAMPHAVVPQGGEASDLPCTEFRRINVLVPTSDGAADAAAFIAEGWETNVVVSAEDRPDLDHATVFVRDRNLVGHCAAAIAAIGGLWRGVGAGATDTLTLDSTSQAQDLTVLRAGVRVVLGGDPAERVARDAMALATADEAGPAAFLDWAVSAADPAAITSRATGYFLGRGDWAPGSPPLPPDPVRRNRGLWAALRDAVAFNAAMFRMGLDLLVHATREAIEDRATAAIVGRDTDTRVRIGPHRADAMVKVAAREIERQERALAGEAKAARARSVPAPRPDTWRELREVVFALADGGDLPEGLEASEYASLRELAPPWALSPDPLDVPWPEAPDVVLRDPGAYRVMLAALLEERRAVAEAETDDAAPPPADAERARSDSRREHAHGAEDEAAHVSEAAALDEQVRALQEWLVRRQRSVTWGLAEDLADRMARLDATVAAEAAALPPVPPDPEPLRRALRSVRRWWWGAVVVLLVLVVVAGAFGVLGSWLVPPLALAGAAVAVPLLLVVAAHHRYYRAQRRFEWAVAHLLTARRALVERSLFARRERARLELLSVALADWAEILGHLLHHPWCPEGGAGALGPGDVEAFPAAVAVATARAPEPATARRLAEDAVPVVAGRGWCAANFDALVESVAGAGTGAPGHLAADLDVRDSPSSARRRLLDGCRAAAGECPPAADVATELAIARVRGAVEEGRLVLPARIVSRAGRYADGLDVTEPEFFRGSLRGRTAFALDEWTPVAAHAGRQDPEVMLVWLPRSGAAPIGAVRDDITVLESVGSIALRVDIRQYVRAGDLAVFSRPTAEVPPADPHPEPPDGAPGVDRGGAFN